MDTLTAARVLSLRVQIKGELTPLSDSPIGPTIATTALPKAATEKRADITIPAQPTRANRIFTGDEAHQRYAKREVKSGI
jgi:hypothetical protein